MKIVIDIKPYKIEARTKREITNEISRHVGGFIYDYRYGRITSQGEAIGIVYEKRRRKVDSKKVTKTFRGEKKKVYREVSRGYWIAYVYQFPTDILHLMKVKEISQKKRTFKFIKY